MFTLNVKRSAICSAADAALTDRTLRIDDDGTPRMRHVTSNFISEMGEDVELGTMLSYRSMIQSVGDNSPDKAAAGYSDAARASQ